jgi:hypothetical protein
MSDRFVVRDRPAADLDGPRRRLDGTIPRAPRTRLVIAERGQLGLEGLLDDPPGDGLPDIDGHGLDGIEVDVEPRPLVTVSPPGGDLSPPIRHLAEAGQILGLTLGEWHRVPVLELAELSKMGKSS